MSCSVTVRIPKRQKDYVSGIEETVRVNEVSDNDDNEMTIAVLDCMVAMLLEYHGEEQ